MKLRTRIIWISCVAVLLASLLGDSMIWILNARSLKNEAFLQAYQNFYVVMNDLEHTLANNGSTEMEEVYLQYFFKTREDDYNLCFRTFGFAQNEEVWKEVYNHTVFSAEELADLEYKSRDSVEYAELNLDGKQYLILKGEQIPGYQIYRIEDITYVWDELKKLALYMMLITMAVTAVMFVILHLVLSRVLGPLRELNDTTRHIAEGLYDQRVNIQRQDEIGQLGESFNKMAEAVETRTRNLEESEKRKTLFMGNLTHELKTPMTAISGYAQTLLSVKLSQEDQEEALHYIYEECGRLERLSKKMMKLLELDQETELDMQEIPVKQLFEAAEKSCETILQEKQIRLEYSEHGECFLVDPDLMTDVMINLIDNAVKASTPGSRIILKAYDRCLEVQDFGRGIPKEEQEKILEPFYMIDKSRSRKSGGAGLGLALTAMIAKKHQILLRIDSEEGKGTRIILQFV